ncbi:MAG: 4-alpha-glucanotransferase, partial [Clostridium sp.]|nr:4-alpha-glucanotransferase [Clostridium sp.]
MRRESGILLSIASLPSRYGIGCFSKEAYEFVDQLKEAGQSYWQILPLGPTSYGDSPYQSFSTFAGNPYYISLEELIRQGLLTEAECEGADLGADEGQVDYEKLYQNRFLLLRKAYERSDAGSDGRFIRFKEENAWWLDDYALYMAVKARFDQAAWTQWAEDIRLRWQNTLDYYSSELYFYIEFHQYLQFLFME